MPARPSPSQFLGAGLAALLFAAPAFAGPPLLCDSFETQGAPSLAWGGQGWNQALADYDLGRLVARTEALLEAGVPVIARMETLRRAAIYASRNGDVARALSARLDARISGAKDDDAKALALFDAGYLRETFEDIVRLQGYDMPGIGKVDAAALRALLAQGDGSVRIAQALRLRPGDASMHFAAALAATADGRTRDVATHARLAQAGSAGDRLLAGNIAQLAD